MDKKKIAQILSLLIVIVAAVCLSLIGGLVAKEEGNAISSEEAVKALSALDSTAGEIEIDNKEKFTYGDLKEVISEFGIDYSINKSDSKKIGKDEFYEIYDKLIEKYYDGVVAKKELIVIGTSGNVENSPNGTVYTDEGVYEYSDLFLDGYIDNVVEVYVKENEIVAFSSIISNEVCYKNIWIYNASGNFVNAYIECVDRSFYVDKLEQDVEAVLADVSMINGEVSTITIKNDKISGKVLSVTADYIEVEGYGKVEIDADFKMYKNYNGFEKLRRQDILVGYELQDFVVAEGKICGAIAMYPFEVNNIRVVLKTTGFKSIYHNSVKVSCEGGFYVYSGENLSQVTMVEDGTSLILEKNSKMIKNSRVKLVPVYSGNRIKVESIERNQGNPEYPGTLEIASNSNGIYIINEVNLESYLKLVVPSEMPAGYGVEALKVQAVCARSYAYNQLVKNDYGELGAHIDDSTSYQVYNNITEYQSSNQAVDETCGQVMSLNGEVITAYYYSTSCGHGSNIEIWGKSPESCGYITSHTINSDNTYYDLTTNDSFYNYITQTNPADFDCQFPLYRWNAYLSLEDINTYYKSKASVGKIKSIDVIKRLAGGIVQEIVVTGEKGTYLVEGELTARRFFGNSEIEFTNNNGKTFSMSSLPSGFFSLNPVYEKDTLVGYEIIGGGYGHGLGMSQNGAYAMTKQNYKYEEILKFFYTGIELSKIY